MSFRFPQPSNEDDFERFCQRLMKKKFNDTSIQLYGKRGESQDGVDLISMQGVSPLRGWQCKHHENHKTLPPQELKEEIEKAKGFVLPLDEFYVLSTARKSKRSQNALIKINRDRDLGHHFLTTLWTSEEIDDILSEMNVFDRDYVINGGTGRDAIAIRSMISEVNSNLLAENNLVANDANLQSRLVAAEQHIADENADLAAYELQKIEASLTSQTQPESLYLVSRLKGKYQLLVGNIKSAGRLFLEAFNQMPHLEQAQLNRVLAYELLGDAPKAYELGTEMQHSGVRKEPLPSILFRTSPKPISPKLLNWLDDFKETSEDLNVSMAMDALNNRDLVATSAFCKKARELNQRSSRAALIQAMCHHTTGYSLEGDERRAELEKGRELYESAIGSETDKLPQLLFSDAYRNLASIQALLGEQDPCDSFEKAISLSSSKGGYIADYLNYLCAHDKYEAAKLVLEEHADDTSFPDEDFLRLVIQFHTASTEDENALVDSMFDLAIKPNNSRREESLGMAIRWSAKHDRLDEAIEKLDANQDRIETACYHGLRAWIFIEQQLTEQAKSEADLAEQALAVDANKQLVSFIARLLLRLNLDSTALPLLERCADTAVFSDETKALLDCSISLGRHDVTLAICKNLRVHQAGDPSVRLLEIKLLCQYQPKDAIELLKSNVAADANNRLSYAYLKHTQWRVDGVPEDLDLTKLPKPDEIAVHDSHVVLELLKGAGFHKEAIDFSLSQLCLNQKNEIAHLRYIWLFTQRGAISGYADPIQKVNDKCVVRYRDLGEETKTVVIQEGPLALNGVDCRTPEDSLAKLLIGNEVGSVVEIGKETIQPRSLQILEILPLYTFYYQHVHRNFQTNFPETTAIQMVKVETEGKFDISPILQGLQARREYCESVLDEFRRLPAAIGFLAKWLGISYFDSYQSLSLMPDIGIRCSFTVSETPPEIANRLNEFKRLVLDLSSLITLYHLNLWESLRSYELFVGQTSFDQLVQWKAQLEDEQFTTSGFATESNGKILFEEYTDEIRSDREKIATKLIELVQEHCVVESSSVLPSLDSDERHLYEELESIYVLETVLLGQEMADCVLLSDDMYSHWMAKTDYRVQAIRTQQLLAELHRQKTLSSEQFIQASSLLLELNFRPLEWNAEIASAACRRGNWDVGSPQVRALLWLFADETTPLRARCEHAVHLLQKMYFYEQVSEFLHTSFINAVLNAINNYRATDLMWLHARHHYCPYPRMLADLQLHFERWKESWTGW